MDRPGLNADQNFYSRSNRPLSPSSINQSRRFHHLDQPDKNYGYENEGFPSYRSASTSNYDGFDFGQLSSSLVDRSNELAYGANNALGLGSNDSEEPDDFYKAYKGAQQSLGGYTEVTTTGMPATASENRGGASSLRSNGNGTTPKHPSIAGTRSGVKSSYRSASAPVDTSSGIPKPVSGLNGTSGTPKVKDLLKKFDANNSEPSAVPRPYPRSVATKKDVVGGAGVAKARAGYMAQISNGTKASEAAPKAGMATRTAPGSTNKSTQRQRFMTEDQQSSNALSSSVRGTREKAGVRSTNGQTSKHSADYLPTSSRSPEPSKSTLQHPKKAPLFGEIIGNGERGTDVGYGISRDGIPPPINANVAPSTSDHGRNHSDPDHEVSPSSPTAWYLGVTPTLTDLESKKIQGHERSHGGATDTSTNNLNGVTQASSIPREPPRSPPKAQEQTKKISKLPVSSHRLSNPSEASSSSSSQPNSPFMSRKLQSNRLQKTTQRPFSPTLRAPTPSNRPKTPSRPSSRLAARRNDETKISGTLNAYVSAPLPQRSPPLRSSRPRLPVQVASTESSRARTRDRSHSPVPTGIRVTRNTHGNETRSHGVENVGKEQLATAAARLRQGLTRTYSQRDEAEKRTAVLQRLEEKKMQGSVDQVEETDLAEPSTPVQSPVDATAITPRPLKLCTSFPRPCHHKKHLEMPDSDSPTLGMPGSFVDDDSYPTSAVSAMTGTTDIDTEEQTEEARYRRISPSQKFSVPAADPLPQDDVFKGQHMEDVSAESIQIVFQSTRDDSNLHQHNEDMLEPTDTAVSNAFDSEEPSNEISLEGHDAHVYLDTTGRPGPRYDSAHPSTLDELEVESPVFGNLNGGHFQHPLTNEREYHVKAIEKHRSGSKLNSRDSYDPYRVSSPLFRPSAWTNQSVDPDTNDDYKPPSLVVSNILRESNPPVMEPISPGSTYNTSPSSPRHVAELLRRDLEHPQFSTLTSHNGFGIGSDNSPVYTTPTVALWPENEASSPTQPGYDLSNPPSRSPPPPAILAKVDSSSASGRDSDTYSSQEPSLRPQSSTQASMEVRSSEGASSFERERPSISLNSEELASLESTKSRLQSRYKVVEEIINGEAVHLRDLTVIQEIYKGTAEICPKLSAEDINLLFRNIDELVEFTTMFLDELKAAAAPIYTPKNHQSRYSRSTVNTVDTQTPSTKMSDEEESISRATTLIEEMETRDQNDSKTFLGRVFVKHAERIGLLCKNWLASADAANKRYEVLQKEPAVQVWSNECDLVAKELTNCWNYNSLITTPFQRFTRYLILLTSLKGYTSFDHPDFENIDLAMSLLDRSLTSTNQSLKTPKADKKKRKESDLRGVFKTLLSRRSEKPPPVNSSRPKDDEDYVQLKNRFGEDFLRIQLVLRDVEALARAASEWVQYMLDYFSAMELTMRTTTSNNPEVESKWARFNISMRDMGTHILSDHVGALSQQVIHPFEAIIQSYSPVELAMKQRSKRRIDYEKSVALKAQGKKVDSKLQQLVDEYEAIDASLKKELPKLSRMTTQMGQICIGNLVNTQARWWHIWQEKLKAFLEGNQIPIDVTLDEIVERFKLHDSCNRGLPAGLEICRKQFEREARTNGRVSQSTLSKEKPTPSSMRSCNVSISSNKSPSIPQPDFAKRVSGQFQFSPINSTSPSVPPLPTQMQNYGQTQSRNGSITSSATQDIQTPIRTPVHSTPRPGTGRSMNSTNSQVRDSSEYYFSTRRESGSTTYSARSPYVDGPPPARPHSGLFNSHSPHGLDGHDESTRSSRASSRERVIIGPHNVGRYNVIYLAASLFEFSIDTIKKESGYPYLTYLPGEIFDVIGEKGELWLAKNQDDISDTVGWIWSKHFARLAML